jgi:cyclase
LAYPRIIARLDIKAPNLIKGVHLEGLRKLGDPRPFVERYYAEAVDEIVYIDSVASLYERNTITDLVEATARHVFVPMTVGGGVRSVEDARQLLRAGADKVAVNTAALKNPELIDGISRGFGSQCMVLSIQAKRNGNDWEAYMDFGREHSGRSVIDWAREGAGRGAGEILLTSVDRDGTEQGFDLELIRAVTDAVGIPVIASGGFGKPDDAVQALRDGGASACAIAKALHYNKVSIRQVKDRLRDAGIATRTPVPA